MYGYRFLSRRFTDRCEILHGGSAWYRTGLLLFLGITPEVAKFCASTEPAYGGICFLLKHLFCYSFMQIYRNWCPAVDYYIRIGSTVNVSLLNFNKGFPKWKLQFPGHQISWAIDWLTDWLIDYASFSPWSSQQWRPWDKQNLAQR